MKIKITKIPNNKKAFGGWNNTHGGDFSNGVIQINSGGLHSTNSMGGVPMGVAPDGKPNLVEEGEVIFNDYVFSNRLKVPKAIRQKYKLRDNITFADAAKKLSKESEDRPNDPISKRGLESFMSALAESQEEVRISKELHKAKNNKFAYGGSIKDILEEFKSIKDTDFDNWRINNPDKYQAISVLTRWLSNYLDKDPNLVEDIDKIISVYDQLDDLDKKEIEEEIEERIQHLNNGYNYFKNDFYNELVNSESYRISGTLGGLKSSPYARKNASSYIDKAIAKYGMEKPLSEITEDEWKEIYEDSQKEFENSILYGTDADNSDIKQEDIRDIPGLEFPYLEPTAGDIPVLEGLSIEGLKPLDIPEKRKSKNSYLRYAPIAASGIAVLNDILGGNEPNYTNADIFAKAIRDSYRPVSTRPIGEYLPYKPFDRMFYINQLNKNSAANRRAIQNTSGGNRAAALASLLASDYNYSENLGKLGRQAEEYNQALKEKATDFNRRTNMYNSEQGTKVDMFNSELKAKQASLYGQLAGMRQSILNSNMEEKRENMTNFIQGLGDLGREMEQKQWRKALYNTGYFGKSKELEQLLGII